MGRKECGGVDAGKSQQLYRHDLVALHNRQGQRFSLPVNRIPERLVPRRYAATSKVADTKGCLRCCVGRNPYNGYKYLCGVCPLGVFLMQWYNPLSKFMLLKVTSLTHAFVHSLEPTLTPSLPRSLARSLTDALPPSFIHSC